MMKLFFGIIFLSASLISKAGIVSVADMEKDTLPYYEIPTYPDSFSAELVVARMIDGLGFRFYWATEGLRPEDLAFRPSPEARSTEETIGHILELCNFIMTTVQQAPNLLSGEEVSAMSFEAKRKQTLESLKTASDLLKTGPGTLADYPLVFQNGGQRNEFPFWNMLNGPIADALWHTGQVVSFRRSSGNPFDSRASVFTGRFRER